ncbi:helix-turn-helix domain-containing protein [Poritiphilus flavus]|uniref:Helix-turn-helix domain-containing protein n=1 Tax=Poritiphilus flavus TaxID=2697053 RepID=A0A6L9E843_9FLAO|nr:AraC family transcriptional regulator [Poritiphilus flavus]NAS10771.1 helix-turn-helix domain-containing protein [Poritiphilus flavus]
MSLDVTAILSLLVSFQLFFITFFLITLKKGKKLSNLLLGVFFLLLAINVTDMLLQINGVRSFLPLFLLVDDSFILLFGPLLHLYTRSVVYDSFRMSRKEWRHFIPFFICFAGLLGIYSLAQGSYESSLGAVAEARVPVGIAAILLICYLHGALYLWWSKRILISYDGFIRQRYSNLKRINLNWLHFVINSFIVVWFLGLVLTLTPFTSYKTYLGIPLFGFVLFLFYFINRVILKALNKPELFSIVPFPDKKYSGSGLTETQRTGYADKLTRKMEAEELYLNPDLSVSEVAETLNITSKELSQTINQSFGQHFFDFVNSYRIAAAKKLLKDPLNKMTIQEIMYAVGFSSKSSFNTVFKKSTHSTPTQYRETFRKRAKKGSLS